MFEFLFWVGIIYLFYWFYKQFQEEEKKQLQEEEKKQLQEEEKKQHLDKNDIAQESFDFNSPPHGVNKDKFVVYKMLLKSTDINEIKAGVWHFQEMGYDPVDIHNYINPNFTNVFEHYSRVSTLVDGFENDKEPILYSEHFDGIYKLTLDCAFGKNKDSYFSDSNRAANAYLDEMINSFNSNEDRLKLVNYFKEFLSSYWYLDDCKVLKASFDFNIKDDNGGAVMFSPDPSETDSWIVKGTKGAVRINSLESIRDDLFGYLGFPVSFEYKDNQVMMMKSIEQKLPEVVYVEPNATGNIVYGISVSGEAIGTSILDDQFLLIVGQSGSGKSVLQQSIIQQLYCNLDSLEQLYLVDLKGGVEFFEHVKKPKTTVVEDITSLSKVVADVVDIVRERYEFLKLNGKKSFDGPKVYFIVDEYAQINLWNAIGKEDIEIKRQLLANLNTLSTLGRAAGVKLIVGLQKCTASEMDTGFKNNLHNRILMKSNNPKAFEEVFGIQSFDVEVPKPTSLAKGEILYFADSSDYPVHLKVPLIREEHQVHFEEVEYKDESKDTNCSELDSELSIELSGFEEKADDIELPKEKVKRRRRRRQSNKQPENNE